MSGYQNPFLRGFLGSQEAAQRQESGQIQQLGGLLGIQNSIAQQQENQQNAPLRRELMQAQINKLGQPQPGQSIGSGGLRMADGTVIPPAARPGAQQSGSPISRLIAERDAIAKVNPQDPNLATYNNAIRKESETARQISPTIVMPKADKVPMGYRQTQDGGLEPIPGGPADSKIQGAYNADSAALQSSVSALDRLQQQVKVTKSSNLGRITGLVGALPNIPGSEGSDAKARLDSLRSQVGMGVLQELRNTSRTGASGLGQVTEREHAMLQQQLGNLETAQSEEEIRRVLDEIETFTEASKSRIQRAYNMRNPNPQSRSTDGAPKPRRFNPATGKIED